MPRPAKSKPEPHRLAVSVDDLQRVAPTRKALLGLTTRLSREVVDCGDAVGVLCSCPALEAALIIDLIRADDRAAGDAPTRAWRLHNGEKWVRLPDVPLVRDAALAEEVFGVAPLQWREVEPEPIQFGD